jgi:DNA-3-methyladenine glycosylase
MEQAAQVSRAPALRLPGRLPSRSCFEASPRQVAPWLLGKLLVCRVCDSPVCKRQNTQKSRSTQWLVGRIVEVEAYLGPHHHPPDPAAHAHRGPTPRNTVLFGPAAHAYVYAIYGRSFCMNISCEPAGKAGCVLLRALEPIAGLDRMALNRGLAAIAAPRALTSGPSRLCQALSLTRPIHNGLDLLDPDSPLQLRDDGRALPEFVITPRIGIKHAVDWPLRFAFPAHPCVSGPKNLKGRRKEFQLQARGNFIGKCVPLG